MKTQKKSMKKKALLSSVSMLMVATVAVGSATFAWFKQNPNANAQGLSLKATASQGLVIMTDTHYAALSKADTNYKKSIDDFVTTDYLNYDPAKLNDKSGDSKSSAKAFELTPASLDLSQTTKTKVGTAYNALAEANTSYAAGQDSPVDSVKMGTGTDCAVYKESIFCALSGATSSTETTALRLDKLTVNFNNGATALKNSLRVVLTYQPKTGDEVIFGQYALAEQDIETKQPKDRENNMLLSGITVPTTYGEIASDKITTVKFAQLVKDTSVGAGLNTYCFTPVTSDEKPNANQLTEALGQSGDDRVNVYIYLDGEDEDCYSQRINANNIIDSVQINLSIPAKG